MSLIKETIFSMAVALHQAGRLKNTIYASGQDIFVFNTDKTVLLKFSLPTREPGINGEVSFIADHYDSEEFEERDGKIIFTLREGGYVRKKSCIAPEKTFRDIQALYQQYSDTTHINSITFTKPILSLLDDSLSHMEVFSENKKSVIIQRDIYSGSVIRIDRDDSGFGLATADQIKQDFAPIGIRTNDFIALFNFCEAVTFFFGSEPYALITGDKFGMEGVVSGCAYDEMGIVTLSKGEQNGRGEKQKDRRGEQKIDTEVNEGTTKGPKRRRRK